MTAPASPLLRLLEPRSVVVVGASDRPESRGFNVWRAVCASPGLREAYAVNPKYRYIGDHPCFGKIADVPEGTDLAVVALRRELQAETLRALGERKVRAAVVAPVEESLFVEGERAAALLRIGAESGMRLLGPDSIGLMSPHASVNVSFWPRLPRPGNVALLTQSALVATAVLDAASVSNFGFSGVVNTGTEIDLSVSDLLEHYADDPHTRVIGLQIEGLRQPRAFYAALAEAASRKAVVVLHAGGASHVADRLAAYRFGTDAGRDDAFDAMLLRAGAVRTRTLGEFVGTLALLSVSPSRRGSGKRRLAIVSNSSGLAAIAAEEACARRLRVEGLSNSTIHALQKAWPSAQIPVNPIVVGAAAGSERMQKTLELALADPGQDAVLVIGAPGPATPVDPTLRMRARATVSAGKPVGVAWSSEQVSKLVRGQLDHVPGARIAALRSVSTAIAALSHLAEGSEPPAAPSGAPTGDEPLRLSEEKLSGLRGLCETLLDGGRYSFSADEKDAFFEALGVTVLARRPTPSLSDARAAAQELGWPVSLRADDLSRPQEPPLALERALQDEEALCAAWERVVERVSASKGGFMGKALSLEKDRPSGEAPELRFAVRFDHVLGPVLEFGFGGRLAGLCTDRAVGLPPLSFGRAMAMVRATRAGSLSSAPFGLSEHARTLAAALLCRLSSLAEELPLLRDLTLDPVAADEGGLVALKGTLHLYHAPLSPDALFSHLTIQPAPTQRFSCRDKTGRTLRLRALLEDDYPVFRAFIGSLSPETVRLRFHSAGPLSEELIGALCRPRADRESAWVLEDPDGSFLAVARWKRLSLSDEAEFGIVVRDDCRRRGLARHLMAQLERTAIEQGIVSLVGFVLEGNAAMEGLMFALGFERDESAPGEGMAAWRKPLLAPEPPAEEPSP